MVDDEKYEVAFEIIACAGDAKSLALMAIEEARNGNFEQAEKKSGRSKRADGQGDTRSTRTICCRAKLRARAWN